MRKRMIFSIFLVSTLFTLEMTSCADHVKAETTAEKKVENTSKEESSKKKTEDKQDISNTSSEHVSITLPDIITYFMSSF